MRIKRTDVGPRPRDELAALSNAPASTRELAPIPGYDVPSPDGHTEFIDGRGVYVRRIPGPTTAPHTWYIHGLEGMSQNWDRLGAALSKYSAGFAPDLPGSGQSEPPPGRYSLATEVHLLARLIRRTSRQPVHLVGNSRGGVVATFLAAAHPGLVRTLTLISPAVPDFRLTTDRGADPRLALVMLPGVGRLAQQALRAITPTERARGLAAMCFGEPDALSVQDLAAAERAYALRAGLPWTTHDTVMALRSLIRAQLRPGRWSFAAAARGVAVPVLVVWGTRDRLVDARLAAPTAARFADSRLLILPRTGHVAQMERPAETARAMLALWDGAAGADDDTARAGASRTDTPVLVAP